MVFCAASGKAVNFVAVAPVGVSAPPVEAGLVASVLMSLPSEATSICGFFSGSLKRTSQVLAPLAPFRFLDEMATISALEASARIVCWTAGGKALNFSDVLLALRLQPINRRLPAITKGR